MNAQRFRTWGVPNKYQSTQPDWPSKVPCRLAFVGDMPTDEDMGKGQSFVGSNGRVLNALLRTAGVERSEHLVTNVFNVAAPDGDVLNFCAPTKVAREWENYALPPMEKGAYLRPEFAAHLTRLSYEIAKASPNVIIPLGGAALWAFTGISGITTARGAVGQATFISPGTKLLPTLHPAHVIHDFKLFHVVANDIEKALRESDYPEIRLPKRELWLAPTLDDIRHFKKTWLDKAPVISTDIETGWGQITCIGFAPDRRRAIVVPFWDLRKPNRSYWPTPEQELEALELVREVLEGPAEKLGQNFPYDLYWLWDKYAIKPRNYRRDTRLAHHALYPELPKDLGFMGAIYAQQTAWKLMRHGGADKRDE